MISLELYPLESSSPSKSSKTFEPPIFDLDIIFLYKSSPIGYNLSIFLNYKVHHYRH